MIAPDEIRALHACLPGELRDSPLFNYEDFSGNNTPKIYLKLDCLNPIGSFKGRGAFAVLRRIREAHPQTASGDQEIVCTTTGNFGLGIAYACRIFAMRSTVFLPVNANRKKVLKLEALGANVVVHHAGFYAAEADARSFAERNNSIYVTDGTIREMAVGAGTAALEITGSLQGTLLEAVFIPVGDGSLICGMGSWFKQMTPNTKVIGVQTEAAPAATLSWKAKHRVTQEPQPTVAEGIGTRELSQSSFDLIRQVVDEMVLVSEEAIIAARERLEFHTGVTVEGAAATTLAALEACPNVKQSAVLMITGSNCETRRK